MKTTMALFASLIGLSHGATILTIDTVYTGATPTAAAPWVTITATTVDTRSNGHFADVVNINVVASQNVTGTEFISKLALTLADSADASNTVLDLFGTYGPPWSGPQTFEVDPDNVHVGGGDRLDLGVEFVTSNKQNGVDRFKDNKSFDLQLTYTGTGELNGDNVFGDDPVGVIHVQGINGEDSGWAKNVPEPGVTMLLGSFAIISLLRRRK